MGLKSARKVVASFTERNKSSRELTKLSPMAFHLWVILLTRRNRQACKIFAKTTPNSPANFNRGWGGVGGRAGAADNKANDTTMGRIRVSVLNKVKN